MPQWRPSWSEARTWFVTVRLLEVAVLVLVVTSALGRRMAWVQAGIYGPPSADGTPVVLTFWRHVAASANGWFGGAGTDLSTLLAAALVVASVAILHLARVSQARLVRWEVLGVGVLAALWALVVVGWWAVSGIVDDPYNQRGDDPNVVYGDQGPGPVSIMFANLGVPVTAVLVLVVAGLWWLRLPTFDDTSLDADDADVGRGSTAAGAGGEAADDERGGRGRRVGATPGANDDDISLDGVEQIAPVERLSPRDDGGRAGDGGTSSGYDDYFRRF
ncbi:hypothetical protein [Knoellia koreensis]|uniref:Uncharacterized protein n=1 Tax=Knoellia koreensis TaxID=2730921 RepID=A0A849HIL3_9MICO|nr:hypothetical protein [Knoellia sp. DB2414S]NNM46141.1 hypothetical protein [Knoellia sp. DB2414S]